MCSTSFRQLASTLGGTHSASSMARSEGIQWPPPPTISLRRMLCFGLVNDSQLQAGDVLVFVPTDVTGAIIDSLTGSFGYSHCGLVCGDKMFDVDNTNNPTVPQVEAVDLQVSLRRHHFGCCFGLSQEQAGKLCACVMAQVGESMDVLELVTFGALHQPGRELCTMLIMHCLDRIGYHRSAIGLGGFVSPNRIAHAFHAPEGEPFRV